MIAKTKIDYSKLPIPKPKEPLSEQEIKVLRLAAIGLGNNEIAKRLFISTHTVKAHLKSIYVKMGIGNRTGAVFFYFCLQNNLEWILQLFQ